jgi:hypothetical protein
MLKHDLTKTTHGNMVSEPKHSIRIEQHLRTPFRRPGLYHIFIRLGLAPPMPPSLHGPHACTYVGTLPR